MFIISSTKQHLFAKNPQHQLNLDLAHFTAPVKDDENGPRQWNQDKYSSRTGPTKIE